MGMILIPLYILYMFAVALVVILVRRFATRSKSVTAILIAIGVLLPTYDIIITNALGAYYCKADPNPKTFIKEKVEYPESIYWEDNVYPGFSEEDRKLMVQNYLDGIHLKTMALNGDDGKVYVYTREVSKNEYLKMSNSVSDISKKIKNMQTLQKDRQDKQYIKNINKLYKEREIIQNKVQKFIKSYSVSKQIFTQQTMPKINYTVTFNEIKLNSFARKFLYSDEIKIINNKNNEILAYNRRYMRFFYILLPDVALGDIYYYPEPMCGVNTQYFSDNVFQKIHMNSGHIMEDFNSKLYQKYIKRGK